jgi:thiamine pyrophosphate-dependent acetolactate synthase large subunit-like protein
MFGGREHGTMFHQGDNRKPYNPDFAAWARATGVDAMTVTKSQDFKGALEHVKANKPFGLDGMLTRRCAAVDWRVGIAADALQGACV